MSTLSGTWMYKHEIFSNEAENPNKNYPSIFKLIKDNNANKKVYSYGGWNIINKILLKPV